jgi:hypothetical protein
MVYSFIEQVIFSLSPEPEIVGRERIIPVNKKLVSVSAIKSYLLRGGDEQWTN